MLWEALSVSFLLYTLIGIGSMLLSFSFINEKSNFSKKANEAKKIYIVIPLLREQKRIDNLFKVLDPILKVYNNIDVVLVTTEREYIEQRGNCYYLSTPEIIADRIKKPGYNNRIFHCHYPMFNKVVAEQLNYAVSYIKQNLLEGVKDTNKYLVFYNADSKIDVAFFDKIIPRLSQEKVFQQSSLFTSNIKSILKKNKYLTASFGVYQSLWTIKHEIPRLLIGSNYYRLLPNNLSSYFLNYCITHGLIIPLEIFDKINGFPITKQGGEDIAIGYVLRAEGYKIEPVKELENSDTPETFKSLYNQLSHWYIAILGYVHFHRIMWKNGARYNRKRMVFLSFQGLYDCISWLLKGWLIILYLVLGIVNNLFLISLFIVYLNCTLSLLLFMVLYNKLSDKLFTKFSFYEFIILSAIYPLTIIIRSLPSINGLIWYTKIQLGIDFTRKKTE